MRNPHGATGLLLRGAAEGVPAPGTASQRRLAALLSMLVLVLPLLATSIPPLVDYPNHLARFSVLVAAGTDPALDRMFEVKWAFYPNLVTDLLVLSLARMMPLDAAGRVAVGCAILLPILGVVALHRALHGTWRLWPWIAVLTSYNGFLTLGFLNYVVGVGMALLGASALLALGGRPAWLRAAAAGVFGVATLLCHLFAFALFLLLVAVLAPTGVKPAREAAARRGLLLGRHLAAAAVMVLVAAAPALALYVELSPERSYGGGGYGGGGTLTLALHQILQEGLLSELLQRLLWLASPFSTPGSVLLAPSLLLVLAIPALALLTGGTVRSARPVLLVAIALAAGYLLLPLNLLDTGLVYRRLALPLALVCIVALDPMFHRRGVAAGLLACGVLLVGARSALTAWTWSGQEALLRDLRTAMAPIEPGGKVLAVRDGTRNYRAEPDETGARVTFHRAIAYQHLPALVIVERSAFWPLVFAAPGKQPIRVRPPFDEMAQHDGGHLPLTHELRAEPDDTDLQAHVVDWPQRYDYVLRLNHHPGTAPPDPHLVLVVESGFAALYRVRNVAPSGK
jgi:hypothetical protein